MTTKQSRKMKITYSLLAILMVGIVGSCTKEPANPFGQVEPPDENPMDSTAIDSTSIAGLHTLIFSPTCANSGCHDGTFEPDFRTISSTYNNLVYQPVIKNDPQESFTYRVLPGEADQSQLLARLTYDIDGNSGIMPLVTEPDSDYPENKERYIQLVKTWITEGAKDVNGNVPTPSDALPEMKGAAAYSSFWLKRRDGQGSLEVDTNTTLLSLYFSVTDDLLEPQDLKGNKIKFSTIKDEFSGAREFDLEVLSMPILQEGYWGEEEAFYHKIEINPKDFIATTGQVYFRIYISDDSHPLTEIPSNGSTEKIKEYFSFTIAE